VQLDLPSELIVAEMHIRQILEGLVSSQARIELNQEKMMTALSDLQAAELASQTQEAAAITLLQTISADLTAALAAGDTAAIEAVVTKINADTAVLAAAVAANPAPVSGATGATGA
jgi:hypothetical protein